MLFIINQLGYEINCITVRNTNSLPSFKQLLI